jgi:MoaA/NifB/PqqE/SkfB family radical SAM enzyme
MVLSPELVMGALSEVEKLGIGSVYFSGGEPFLYDELPQVLAFACQQNNLILHISTNGTLIGAKEAALLKETKAYLHVSMDGPEEYHDGFRQSEGAFRNTSRGIQHLVEAGVPVDIVMTVSRDNLSYLTWLAEWAVKMGVKRLNVQPLLNYGRGANIRDRQLSAEQMCDLFLLLSDLGVAYRSKGLELGLSSYRTKAFLTAHPCAAYVCNGAQCHRKLSKEIKKLVIREDGMVLPEIATLNYRYALGNLREGSLCELVTRYMGDGYAEFDRLCRSVYEQVMPTWTSPLIPWDEIVSERSWISDA